MMTTLMQWRMIKVRTNTISKLYKQYKIKIEKGNAVLEMENCLYYDQIKSFQQQNSWEVQIGSIPSQIFSPGQIKLFLKKNTRIQWSSEDIACAISLRSVSMKTYIGLKFLNKNLFKKTKENGQKTS